jgi:hypothetical protein
MKIRSRETLLPAFSVYREKAKREFNGNKSLFRKEIL